MQYCAPRGRRGFCTASSSRTREYRVPLRRLVGLDFRPMLPALGGRREVSSRAPRVPTGSCTAAGSASTSRWWRRRCRESEGGALASVMETRILRARSRVGDFRPMLRPSSRRRVSSRARWTPRRGVRADGETHRWATAARAKERDRGGGDAAGPHARYSSTSPSPRSRTRSCRAERPQALRAAAAEAAVGGRAEGVRPSARAR